MRMKRPISAPSSIEAKKILVVEDDHDILEAIQVILESRGYQVLALDRGDLVEKELQRFQPDLALLDIWINGSDGRDVARWLKKHEATKHVPIIMVSANIATQKIAKDVKADDFILKPFDLDHLLSVVEKRLKKSHVKST
jgi:DNA-binding response OmpR family regulator